MSKKFTIGVNRSVTVKKQAGDLCITISEEGTDKLAEFTSKRWVQFVRVFDQIDESLIQMRANQPVQYCTHIGGKWYVSVTNGFACVDIRQFYYHPIQGPRPTKKGIALRITEWVKLKDVVQQLDTKYPMLTTTQTCSSQADHYNLEGALSCLECFPFQSDELYHSTTAWASIHRLTGRLIRIVMPVQDHGCNSPPIGVDLSVELIWLKLR